VTVNLDLKPIIFVQPHLLRKSPILCNITQKFFNIISGLLWLNKSNLIWRDQCFQMKSGTLEVQKKGLESVRSLLWTLCSLEEKRNIESHFSKSSAIDKLIGKTFAEFSTQRSGFETMKQNCLTYVKNSARTAFRYHALEVKSFSWKNYMFRGGGSFRQFLDLLRLIFDFGLLVPLLSKLFFFVADEATKLSRVLAPRTCFGLIR
jgi:hypothetical protein